MSSLLRNSIILDTETLGLDRGAGMHELAFMDMQSRHVRSFVLQPNAVHVRAATQQERTKLAGAGGDVFERQKYGSWTQALHDMVERAAGHDVPAGQTMSMLKEQQPWLHAQLKHYPHLLAKQDDLAGRTRVLGQFGAKLQSTGKPVAVADALGALKQAMSGKTVWIANAAFEAKQIGAQLGPDGPAAWEQFKSGMETWNPNSPDPFYVTGSEVTKARTLAGQTGDWTGVWKAYKQYTPQAGETAVRDIQDVTRALHSYGKKLGLTKLDAQYLGTGIDISHRLHAIAAGDSARLNMKEFHRAAEDVAIHEAYVLERNVELVQALQDIYEGTAAGRRHLADAAAGRGVLQEAGRYFQALEAHAPALLEEQALKRLHRAHQDIAEQGATYQRTGASPYAQAQLGPDGSFRRAHRLTSHRTRMTDMNQVIGFMEQQGTYGDVDLRAQYNRMKAAPDVGAYVHQQVKIMQDAWRSVHVGSEAARVDRVVRNPRGVGLGTEVLEMGAKSMRGKAGAVLAVGTAVAAVGAAVSLFQNPVEPDSRSLLHYGYQDWASRNAIEGLSTGPVASAGRHHMTDFGSPYQGPVGVQQVFIDQERFRARERWLRSQYGAYHRAAPVLNLNPFSAMSVGKSGGGGYDFIQGGQTVDGGDYAMRGKLKAINLQDDGWKMSIEDADTVTLRKGGLRGALGDFFGLNKSYSFRLAGLDAPETAHGDRAAQPWANEATSALRQMMANAQDVTLLFDPTQTTYGRAMGGVFADGKNVNIQLVQQGLASHLPFGNPRDAIIDYRALKGAEQRAYAGNRGMWSQPWARTFYEHSEASGRRVTFNQLAKTESIVKNFGTMQMVAAMDQAQAQGTFTPRQQMLAQELGSSYNVGDDKVGPWSMSASSTPSTSYLQEQLQDLAQFTKTKGRGGTQNKYSRRSGYGKLDASLVMDTLGTSNNVWTRRRVSSFDQYGSARRLNEVRKSRMAAQQRQALRLMNESPIGHSRM